MGRRRRGRALDGVLILDKPAGITSNKALQIARAIYNAAKAGHTGSLDPLATGVLPLCFGEATKFSSQLLDADKCYRADVVLGVSTDTADRDGEVISEQDASHLSQAQIESALDAFRGDILQVPPMVSALKRDGQPLYKLARQGIEVERDPRPVTIRELTLESFEAGPAVRLVLKVHCSKGTYIRSIASDLGEALGVGGHVAELRRIQAGPFDLEHAVTLSQLEGLKADEAFDAMDARLLPVDAALAHLPELQLGEAASFYLLQGQPVTAPGAPANGLLRLRDHRGQFLGLGEVQDDGRLGPKRLIANKDL